MKVFQPRVASTVIASLITAAGLALCASAAADNYVISVQRTGPLDIYKGYCPLDTTAFTIYSDQVADEDLHIYFFLGGTASVVTPEPPDPCLARRSLDFNLITTPTVSNIFVVPNLCQITIPAGHTSATFYVKASNTGSSCTDPYQCMNLALPGGTDYTGGEYTIDPNAGTATAHVHPPVPAITMSVSPNNFPPNLHKGTTNTISFTLTASTAPPANMLVTFFLGGDGTATTGSDPCLAYGGADFTVSGCSQAPFPNGYYFVLGAGQTQKTVTVAAAGSGCDCEDGFQTLLVTIPEPPACSGYTPAQSGSQTQGYIYPE